MNVTKRFAVLATAVALLAAPAAAVAQASVAAGPATGSTTRPAVGPGWHHVQDFAPDDLGGCHARGQWYLDNGANRYECRPAGVWQLWVLTDS
ncbi:hypothetical protein ACFZBU_11365 [Embleya sp. NPDC008237]|uniref:hypothetical protein n=1 Tax=Embleya sp. NPDC008237 TaxID=3363978 RepID=UPI0036E94462